MVDVLDYLIERLKRGVITFIHAVILANWELPFHDFMTATTTANKKTYVVGTNNLLGRGDQHKRFVSKLTPIFCTTNTYVIFNSTENVPHLLLANTWYNFKINVWQITYYYVQAEGTIYAHFGGVLPNEARGGE